MKFTVNPDAIAWQPHSPVCVRWYCVVFYCRRADFTEFFQFHYEWNHVECSKWRQMNSIL